MQQQIKRQTAELNDYVRAGRSTISSSAQSASGEASEIEMPLKQKRTESEIRDQLARNLDLIECGLSLIDKEVLLPNDKGAKGFLDIFCRTANGKYLIIEVKRSDTAAREAIHELVKYVALLKQNLLVKGTEVRLMVASSEWHELLVPFSEFIRSAPYDCGGLRLILGNNGLVASTDKIRLSPEEKWRRLNRRHAIWGFEDEEAALAAIPLISDYLHTVGLQDFVLVMLAINTLGEEHHRFVYFAQQELSLEAYLALIRSRFSAEELLIFEEWIEDLTEIEDRVAEAADKVWEPKDEDDFSYGRIKAIDQQIAHPEKARSWFAPERLVSSTIFRFGRFKDPNISDKMIVDEILGEDGASFHHGYFNADLSSKTEIAALLSMVDNLFDLNPSWRTAVHDLCSYAQKSGATSVSVRAFSNEDVLRTVAGMAIGYSGYVPTLVVEINRGDSVERIFGTLEWNGRKPPTFDRILKKYFENDSFHYFTLCHFGSQKQLNADLMGELGLSYSLCMIDDDLPIPVRVRPSSIENVQDQRRKSIDVFLAKNAALINQVVDLFLKHDGEFQKIFDCAALCYFEKRLDESKCRDNVAEPIYWSGKIEHCDVCKRDMSKNRFMVDSAVVKNGPWVCMCAVCFGQTGGSIGWGKGQFYERDERGWRLIGGGPPIDEGDGERENA